MRAKNFTTFCIKIFLFIALLFIADRGIGMAFIAMKNIGLTRNPENMWLKTPYVVEKVNEDILIIGSSKATHSYIPKMFEGSLHATAYNCGQDGCFFLYQNCIINMVVDKYKPKMIIWDIQPSSFDVNNPIPEFQNIRYLSPYYGKSHWVTSYVNSEDSMMQFKMLSKMFEYNSKLLNYIFPLISNDEGTQNGYIPLPTEGYNFPKMNNKISRKATYQPDSYKLNLLAQTIKRCKSNNIKLVLIISPEYTSKSYSYEMSLKDIKKVVTESGNNCFDYSSNNKYMEDATLFKDASHLNNKGAKLFTRESIIRIR